MKTFKEYFILKEENTVHNYSSTQINLPQFLASQIIKWGDKHISDSDLFTDENDLGREDEMHVTILYGLNDQNIEKPRKLLTKIHSFEIELGKISMFTSNDKFNVVCILNQ